MSVFTILTPAYNHEKYLGECILSVVRQSFPDWEMIIIDDGSTDRTAEIAASWSQRESRIRLIRQENQGIFCLAETYNKGLQKAGGRYISILEGDDLWEPDKLQRQFDILEKRPEVVVAWGRAAKVQAETGERQGIIPAEGSVIPDRWKNIPTGVVLESLYIENMIPAVTITMRRSVLEEAGGFIQPPEFPTTDLPTLMELALKGSFCFDEKVIAAWRVYSRQTTKLFPVAMLTQRWRYCLNHYGKLDPLKKKQLKTDERQINRHFKKRMMVAYAISGRYKLIRREFRQARHDYLKAIFYPSFSNPVWRLRAITGLIFSLFQKDVEGLSQRMGKVTYKS